MKAEEWLKILDMMKDTLYDIRESVDEMNEELKIVEHRLEEMKKEVKEEDES